MIWTACVLGALLALWLAVSMQPVRGAQHAAPAPRPPQRRSREFAADELAAVDLPQVIELPDWSEWDRAVEEFDRACGRRPTSSWEG